MRFSDLNHAATAELRKRGVSSSVLSEYKQRLYAGAAPGSHAPTLCPACYADGIQMGLRASICPNGFAFARCDKCKVVLNFGKRASH